MAWMQRLRKSKSLQYGLPMMVLIVGGSFGLREFAQIRYDIQKVRGKDESASYSAADLQFQKKELNTKMDPELEKRLKKSNVTLELEYEKMKNASFDDWKNIRGPRPWEETGSDQEKQQ